jgi:hypothetical protein
MQYSLRTLFIAVTAIALFAAVGAAILSASRPKPIMRSAEGRKTIKLLADADRVTLELRVGREKEIVEFTKTGKEDLVRWLKKGIRDNVEPKRIHIGDLRVQSANDDWLLLKISDYELSIQTRNATWRGLDRKELKRLIRENGGPDNLP